MAKKRERRATYCMHANVGSATSPDTGLAGHWRRALVALEEPADPSRLSALRFWALFGVLLTFASLPVLWTEIPPLLDYPNHLARLYLLSDGRAAEQLRQYYAIDWQVVPNLAMDLLVPPLARLMPLSAAMKLFIILSFALIASGTALVHRACRDRWSIWPLFVFLFLYNQIFLLGFLNYLFGLGLALIAFSLWIALASRAGALRLVIASGFALAIFFAHLMACALYGVMIMSYELGAVLQERPWRLARLPLRLAHSAIAFLPPLALLIAKAQEPLADHLQIPRFDEKLYWIGAVFDVYAPTFTAVSLAILGLATCLGVAARRLAIPIPLAIPLVVISLAFIAAPHAVIGASGGVAQRLPVLIFFLLPAAVSAGAGLRRRMVQVAAMTGLSLFVIHMVLVAAQWQRADTGFARRIAVLDRVPDGGRLAVAHPENVSSLQLPLTHFPMLAMPRRNAFVPLLFTTPGQQIVRITSEGARLRERVWPEQLWALLTARAIGESEALDALRDFDVVLLFDIQPFDFRPPSFLIPIAAEPGFALYRIVH